MSYDHWTQQLDQDAAHRRHEDEARRQRELDASTAAYHAAVAQKRERFGWSLGDLDFDALSQTEQQYQATQDRQARWQQYRATAQAAESGWVRYEQPPAWFQ